MLSGEALGGGPIGDIRSGTLATGWPGAWDAGVRPAQGMRVASPGRVERVEKQAGSKVR